MRDTIPTMSPSAEPKSVQVQLAASTDVDIEWQDGHRSLRRQLPPLGMPLRGVFAAACRPKPATGRFPPHALRRSGDAGHSRARPESGTRGPVRSALSLGRRPSRRRLLLGFPARSLSLRGVFRRVPRVMPLPSASGLRRRYVPGLLMHFGNLGCGHGWAYARR